MAALSQSLESLPRPVTLPVAAYAAGVQPAAMRTWLKGNVVRLLVPRRAAGAWLRCAPVDIVRLAVLGHLIRFGFTVAESNDIVIEYVDRHLEGIVLSIGDCPWHLLASRLRGHTLMISREPSGTAVSFATMVGQRSAKHSAATLEINVGWLAADVRARIREMSGGVE